MYLMCTCGSSSIVNYAGCATIYSQTLQHHLVYSVFVPFIFIRLSRFYCFLLYFFCIVVFLSHLNHSTSSLARILWLNFMFNAETIYLCVQRRIDWRTKLHHTVQNHSILCAFILCMLSKYFPSFHFFYFGAKKSIR